ncbi:hypothetical protein FRC12_001535 [Ceratobasidium sp. 428]|nr:hypothetical protein FRC12_001535 [Ceratobasidium sp. 428]
MGYNFYLEKHTTLGASRRSAPINEKCTLNQSSPRPPVHFESLISPAHTKKASLKSRTVKYFKSVWNKITGTEQTATTRRYSHRAHPIRISNPLRSTITSLAFASFDELPDLGQSKMPDEKRVGTETMSIPVTLDGAVVDHITLPSSLASRIIGASVSENMQSIHLTTQTPPTYEQTHPEQTGRNLPYKPCGIFDDDTMRFAGGMFSPGEQLIVWPAPSNLCSFDDAGRPSSVNSIHRNIRIAPGNMIQVPSMYNPRDSYMLACESSGGFIGPMNSGTDHHESRLFVASEDGATERITTCCRAFVLSQN